MTRAAEFSYFFVVNFFFRSYNDVKRDKMEFVNITILNIIYIYIQFVCQCESF